MLILFISNLHIQILSKTWFWIGTYNNQVIAAIWLNIDEKNLLVKPKNIYNKRATQKQKQLGSLTSVQVFMVKLHKIGNWYIYCVENNKNCIKWLFFAKISLQKFLKYNYEVLLINIIYKTNKYKMPLIIISGVIPLNINYYIGFEFVFKKIYKVYK